MSDIKTDEEMQDIAKELTTIMIRRGSYNAKKHYR